MRVGAQTLLQDMEDFLADYTHATGPGIYELQSGGYVTGGTYFARSRVRTLTPLSVSLPSLQAGCNGIDLHTGSFSFINGAEFEAFARLIVQNATGFAFKLAMESLSPQIAEVLEQLQSIANRINQFSINSCETAQAAVGSLWPKSQTASRAICESFGNSSGRFTDYAQSKHNCTGGGQQQSVIDDAVAAGAPEAEALLTGNIVWKALLKHNNLTTDQRLIILSITGTVVHDDADIQYYPSLLDNKENLGFLLQGGGTVPTYRCDTTNECLNPVRVNLTVNQADSFVGRVVAILERLRLNLANRTAPQAGDIAFINDTSVPVYQALRINQLYGGNFQSLLSQSELAELVALDVLADYLDEAYAIADLAHKKALAETGNEIYKTFQEALRAGRREITTYRSENNKSYGRTLQIYRTLSDLETSIATNFGTKAEYDFVRQE